MPFFSTTKKWGRFGIRWERFGKKCGGFGRGRFGSGGVFTCYREIHPKRFFNLTDSEWNNYYVVDFPGGIIIM